jgi:hypothetical protein
VACCCSIVIYYVSNFSTAASRVWSLCNKILIGKRRNELFFLTNTITR